MLFTSRCCRVFYLNRTPEQLIDMCDNKTLEDWEVAEPMLRYLGSKFSTAAGEAVDFYTCVNVDPAGQCRIYEDRPHFCREYPRNYKGQRCQYRDCESSWCEFYKESNE